MTVATGGAGVPGAVDMPLFDPTVRGYETSEFFVEGSASSYSPVPLTSFTSDGMWTVTPSVTASAYKTRVIVLRPTDPGAFNGTVYVEWFNVTNIRDSSPDWLLAHNEMIEQGAAYVGVSAQAIGVNVAKGLIPLAGPGDPARYGSLIHPGDSFSYDIFSQAGQAARDGALLGSLTPIEVIAVGESQSASRLVTYINAVQPLHTVYDGFFVHSRGATPAAVRGNPPGTIASPANTLIRDDLGVPVFVLQTETDTRVTREPDSNTAANKYRLWEVAGSAHVDIYSLGIGQFDNGLDNSFIPPTGPPSRTAAQHLFSKMLQPTNNPLPGIIAPCGAPVNSGPHHWVVQAAVHHLNEWVTNGTPPPPGAVLTVTPAPSLTSLLLDANGNEVGGVRTPHVDVPVAAIRGVGQPAAPGTFCGLFGTTTPFSTAKLEALYASHEAFVSAWNASVDASVAAGHVLASDAPRLKASAAGSGVGLRLPGAPTITDVSPGDSQLVVSFDPPGVDADQITSYTATCSDGFASTESQSSTGSPITVGGLVDGVDYACVVEATNAKGTGAASAASDPVTVGSPPTITITQPADGSVFVLGAAVPASYACEDEIGGSGLASCIGTVAPGAAIDTSSVGTKSFSVDATDHAGNAASLTVSYQVVYAFGGFLPPINADGSSVFKAGSTVPVKFQASDATGTPIATVHATLTLAKLTNSILGSVIEAVSTAQSTTGNTFRWTGTQYIFNLSTKGLTKGTYRLTITPDDGTDHSVFISLK